MHYIITRMIGSTTLYLYIFTTEKMCWTNKKDEATPMPFTLVEKMLTQPNSPLHHSTDASFTVIEIFAEAAPNDN